MANGHGFVDYAQSPPMQPSGMAGGMGGGGMGGGAPATPMGMGDAGAMLRASGAAKTVQARSVSPYGDDPATAIAHSIGDALTRMGNGTVPGANPFRPRETNARLAMRLGLTAEEVELMLSTGGLG